MGVPLKRSLLASILALSISATVFAAKSLEENWADVGLKIAEVEIDNATCRRSEKDFIACFHGLNAGLAFLKTQQELLPKTRLSAEKGFGSILKDFANVAVVESKKMESESFAELYRLSKDEKKLGNAALRALYQAQANQEVDFEEILAWIAKDPELLKKESMVAGFMLNAILSVIHDPHTYLVPKAVMIGDNVAGARNFTGIGAALRSIKKNGKDVFVIQQPLDGGPAIKAGLHANDVILEIDGLIVDGLDLQGLVDKIKGPKGTTVTLKIERNGNPKEFSIIRDLIEQKNVVQKSLSNGEVGYVKLSDFMSRDQMNTPLTYRELRSAVASLLTQSPKSLILDLRDNGGGMLGESVRVASLFLKPGSLVLSTKSLSGSAARSFKTTDQPLTDIPVVVLINSRSASASEIVSGALQDQQRAFLVGERTYGKGTVQQTAELVSISDLLMARTIERFYLPSGRTNQVEGVLPDLEVFTKPNPTEDDKVALREEDEYAALPSIGNKWTQPRPEVIQKLSECVAKGTAESDFNAGSDAPVLPDYQLLVAQDAAKCAVSEEL